MKAAAEERKELAVLFKQADDKKPISNKKLAKTLNVSDTQIGRDLATNVAPDGEDASEVTGASPGAATNVAPSLPDGERAARIVERRTTGIATAQTRRADRERELAGKIMALPDAKFGVIVADPEWHDEVYSEDTGVNRHASRIYTTSDLETIKVRPVGDIAAPDCVLFLWATSQHLDAALAVMKAWGFTYRSNYVWRKPAAGLGYWSRSVHETLLIGTRGHPPCPAPGTQWESVIDAPRGELHSAKPEVVLRMIEQYFPSVPKIELNARKRRAGWDAWGLEAPTEPSAEAQP